MATVIKAPNEVPFYDKTNFTVFLAGTIDMGASEDWQALIAEKLAGYDVVLVNPRRDKWDPTWTQSSENPEFSEQVNWELTGLETCDLVVFYLAPGSKSPITMAELGLAIGIDAANIIVCCPDGFYRKGNVDIMCERYGVCMVDTLDELVEEIIIAMPYES